MAEPGPELLIEPCRDGFSLVGEIDAYTAPGLEAALDAHFGEGSATLQLAMSGVTFMDSSGLRVVLGATEVARGRGGDVVLHAPTAPVRRLVEVTGLTGHLTMDPVGPNA